MQASQREKQLQGRVRAVEEEKVAVESRVASLQSEMEGLKIAKDAEAKSKDSVHRLALTELQLEPETNAASINSTLGNCMHHLRGRNPNQQLGII